MKINLENSAEGVIWNCDSGYEYTSQSGGMLCIHPKQKGVFIPFPWIKTQMDYVHQELCCLPTGKDESDKQLKDRVDEAINNILIWSDDMYTPFRLDYDRFEDTTEGWVQCLTTGELEKELHSPFHEPNHKVTLVYRNCD